MPFSWGTNPGWDEKSWSTQTVSPGPEISSLRRVDVCPYFFSLKRHGFLWAVPNRQETHGGAFLLRFWNFLGKKPSLNKQNITVNGRCQRRSWRDTNYYCNGERETGLVISSISFLVRLDAASCFSGNIVGIHPISGSSGNRKDSFVVSITSSFGVLTQNCRTAFSSSLISSIRTYEVCPEFV